MYRSVTKPPVNLRKTPTNSARSVIGTGPSKNDLGDITVLSAQQTKILTLNEQCGMIETMERMSNTRDWDGRFDLMVKLAQSEDKPEPIVEENPITKPHEKTEIDPTCRRKINFDFTESLGDLHESGENEKEDDLRIATLVSKTLDGMEEARDLQDQLRFSTLNKDLNDRARVSTLFTLMEDRVIPALEKLRKDPLLIHDLLRKEPSSNALVVPVEDQEEFVTSMENLSGSIQKLTDFLRSEKDFDLEGQFSDLEYAVDEVDSAISMIAADKVKGEKLEDLLSQLGVGKKR